MLDGAVAQNAGIGRQSFGIITEELIDDFLLEFTRDIDGVEGKAEGFRCRFPLVSVLFSIFRLQQLYTVCHRFL
jgi:hypothetical protein